MPYQREQGTIQHLIKYLQKMKVQHGLVDPEDEIVAQQVNQSLQNQQAMELIAKNISDGKMETAYERSGEELKVVGSKKGGKKNKKPRTITVETTFQPSIEAIQKFGLLKIAPPTCTEEIEGKIEELQKEAEKYKELSADALAKVGTVTDEELLAEIEKEERERRKARQDEEGAGRGGPRAARGARGAMRGGRGGRGRAPRDDYEHHSEEEEEVKPKPQKKQQRADLKNMDNFPTL